MGSAPWSGTCASGSRGESSAMKRTEGSEAVDCGHGILVHYVPTSRTARTIRRVVIAVCVVGIAGMIGGSIANRIGLAVTSGVVTAVSVVCLILVTSAAGPTAFDAPPPIDEAAA